MANMTYVMSLDEEDQAVGQDTMKDGVLDYLTFGTKSAVTSGVVGILNTFNALGSSLGADTEPLSEREAIDNLWGSDTADFYDRHKQGVDAAGFLMSAFLPGTLALKGARAAAGAGWLGDGLKAATGMENAGLVLGSTAVQNARTAVLGMEVGNLANPIVRSALVQGSKVAAAEAALFTVFNSTLNNQNAALNPDQLGYVDSLLRTAKDDLTSPLNWGFVGAGGALSALRVRGYLRTESNAQDAIIASNAMIDTKLLEKVPAGDAAYLLRQDIELAKSPEFQARLMEGVDPAAAPRAQARHARLVEELEREQNKYIAEIVQGQDELTAPTISAILKSNNLTPEQYTEITSNLQRAGRISRTDFLSMQKFYSQSAAPLAIVDGVEAEAGMDILADIAQRRVYLAGGLDAAVLEVDGGKLYQYWKKDLDSYNGAALPVPVGRTPIYVTEEGTVLPLGWAWTKNVGEGTLDLYNAVRNHLGQKELSLAEQNQFVLLHELSHLKSNSGKALGEVMHSLRSSPDKELAVELMRISHAARPYHWEKMLASSQFSRFDDMAKALADGTYMPPVDSYLFRPQELLADAGAMLLGADIKAAQQYAKLAPRTAALLREHGGLAMPWKQSKAFMHTGSGKVVTSVLPGAGDLFKYAVVKGHLVGANEKIAQTPEVFKLAGPELAEGMKYDPLVYSKQWTLGSKLDIPFKDGVYEVPSMNHAPALERAIQLGREQERVGGSGVSIRIGGNMYTLQAAEDALMGWKNEKLQMLIGSNLYNEQEIRHILNISEEAAQRGSGTNKDFLLYESSGRDYLKPEYVSLHYKKMDTAGVDEDSRTASTILARQDIMKRINDDAADFILRDDEFKFPDSSILQRALANIGHLDPRQGKVFALRPEIGTLRDIAAQVGKHTGDLMVKCTQQIETEFSAFSQTINHANNHVLRGEIATIDNILRRDWYTIRYVDEVTRSGETIEHIAIMRKSIADQLEETEGQVTWEALQGLPKKDGFIPSRDAGEFFAYHYDKEQGRVASKEMLQGAKGKRINYRDDVLYPPPRDLRQTPHYMFVVPSAMQRTVDPGQFMIVATNEIELAQKKQAILAKYGDDYKIIGREDAKNYKMMQGQYEKGQAFDELEFDSSLRREFKDAELAPNMDNISSGTLERYRQYHARQEEFLVRGGVEAKYAQEFAYLDRMDNMYGLTQKQKLFGSGTFEQENIFGDTKRTMLAVQQKADPTIGMYRTVSSYVNDQGSKVLDGVLRPILFSKDKVFNNGQGYKELTEADLVAINKAAADVGFSSPYEKVSEMILSSPETVKSRSLPTMIRAFNVMAGFTMLTLDTMAAIVNAVSAPIISLPVVREAQKALAGTERGRQLEQVLSVIHPTTGVKEPSVMRLHMDAVQKFWSPEGKQFLQEMRRRNIIQDPFIQYREAQDLADFNGAHSLGMITQKIETMRAVAGKYNGYQLADDFSKFLVAWSVKEVGRLRGMGDDELFTAISSSVDKVQGVYRATQRGELFNGVIGQAVGLFQNYTINWLQNGLRNLELGERGHLAVMAAAQASLFGVRSLPGFEAFNSELANRNRDNADIYTYTGATEHDEKGEPVNPWAQYVMYGLGSHALGIPVDMFNRGDTNPRQGGLVPFIPSPFSWEGYPAFNLVTKAVGGAYQVAKMIGKEGADGEAAGVGQAIIHGFAHNGMNRPLQGLFTIAQGNVTNRAGIVQVDNANYINNDVALGLDYAGMAGRLLGSRPLREAILMDERYRQKAYDAADKEKVAELATGIRMKIQSGQEIDNDDWNDLVKRYELAGGNPAKFNAFMTRTLKSVSQSELDKFRNQMEKDTELRRGYKRMTESLNTEAPWELQPAYDPEAVEAGQAEQQ